MTPLTPFDTLILTTGDQGTLYDNDGVSHPRPVAMVVSNATYVRILGTARGDVIKGLVASTVSILPGQVVNLPAQGAAWFLVVKRLYLTRTTIVDPGHSVALLSLPYNLVFTRYASTGQTLSPYNEPFPTDVAGDLTAPTTTRTIRASVTNDVDQLTNEPVGDLPSAIVTARVPLGSDVMENDTVWVTGEPMVVQQVNTLYADGEAYARQLILNETTGTGLPQ